MLTEAFILSHVSAESHVKKSINKDIQRHHFSVQIIKPATKVEQCASQQNYCAVIIQRTAPIREQPPIERTKKNGKSSVVVSRDPLALRLTLCLFVKPSRMKPAQKVI